jgi:hypothetical protein
VHEVEGVLRNALLAKGNSPTGKPDDLNSFTPNCKSYRSSLLYRFFRVVALAGGVLVAGCVLGCLALVLALPILFPGFVDKLAQQSEALGFLGVVGSLACGAATLAAAGFMAWVFFRFALAAPVEIEVTEDRSIAFRTWVGTDRLRVGEIVSITTGGWRDPNGQLVLLRHKRGKLLFWNQFVGFRDFLTQVRSLNPAIEISGF